MVPATFFSSRPPLRPAGTVLWLVGLIGLVFFGPVGWLVHEWRDNPYYEHGPLVPLVALIGAAVAVRSLPAERRPADRIGPALVAFGLALRITGAAAGSDYLGALGLLPVLAGLTAWWLGWAGLRRFAFPIGYLFLAIPLPLMDDVGFYFQRLSTISTTGLVRLFGVPAVYQGAEVSLPAAAFPTSTFYVGIQCSGLYSTVTLFALGLVFVRLLDLGGWPRRLLLVAAVLPIAILTNDIRLGSLLGLAYWKSADFAMSYYHNLGDVVFWFVALGLFFLVGKVLEWTRVRAA